MSDGNALLAAVLANPGEDTPRLVYADWLDENDQHTSATRLRWWVDARRKVRAGVVWDRETDWSEVQATVGRIQQEWVRRLYAVEVVRIAREKFPIAPELARFVAVADETLSVAERYALLLATGPELAVARFAAESLVELASEPAAERSAAPIVMAAVASAAESVKASVAAGAAWMAVETALVSAPVSDLLFPIDSPEWEAAMNATQSAAWCAAEVFASLTPP